MILWISLRPNCIYLSKGVNTADTHLTENARHYWLVSSTTICNYLLLIILLKTSHRWIKYWISVSFKHDLLFDSYIWCLIASLHLGDTLRRLVDTHGTQHRCVKLNSSLDSPLPFRFWYTFWIFSWESYPLYLYYQINLNPCHALKAPKSLIMSLDAYLKSASACSTTRQKANCAPALCLPWTACSLPWALDMLSRKSVRCLSFELN